MTTPPDAAIPAGLSSAARIVTLAATLGLALVLVASTAFALFRVTATTAAVERSKTAQALSNLYVSARFAVDTEERLERKYHLEPRIGVARAHASAARTFTTVLRTLIQLAPPANVAEARLLLEMHGRYLTATHRMFAAVDAHDAARVLALDHGSLDPLGSAIQARVYARATEQSRRAAAAFDVLESTRQQHIVRWAITLSALGVACLIGFLFVNAARRRLSRGHEVELQRMEEAVLVDSLTKIGNHRAFKEDLQREMSLVARHHVPLTLALVDIDEFKLVNDQNGHLHGDRVLLDLADILRGGRPEDRAYRVGGDEFALLLTHTSAADSRAVLERIRRTASKKLHGSTVSIGYTTVASSGITAEAFQNQADAALYLTKRGGRNGVSQFNASSGGPWMLSTERVGNLRALLESKTLPIAFQPIWDLERAEIRAFEALLRPPASSGFTGPQDAFDLAERIGRAHELDRASWTAALRRAAELPAQVLLFLNISPQTLDRDFDVDEFAASVAAFGLQPQRIVVEITERSIAHVENVVAVARSLQRAGIGIALDDTGAGHAGLEIMSRLHFDYVKIDRRVLLQAMIDRNARGVVAAIVAFAHVTGAYVIAEGVEDIAMLNFVDSAGRSQAHRSRGIRGAQGYLLHRPSLLLPTASEIFGVSALLREHVELDETRRSDGPRRPSPQPVRSIAASSEAS